MNNYRFRNSKELALYVIETYLNNQSPKVNPGDVSPKLQSKGACFVSIYVDNDLRGCIGTWRSFEPLYKNIIRNSIDAVTNDNRFIQIKPSDLPELKVEVSVLSPPKLYRPKNKEELLIYLEKNKPGLVLENSSRRALFLPQVWDSLPDPEQFLSQLCLKAGLFENSWQESGMKFWIFKTKKGL